MDVDTVWSTILDSTSESPWEEYPNLEFVFDLFIPIKITGVISRWDARFQFIQDSLIEFLVGELGLNEALQLLLKASSNPPESDEASGNLTGRKYRDPLNKEDFGKDLLTIFNELVVVTTYELIDMFDIKSAVLVEAMESYITGYQSHDAENVRFLFELSRKVKGPIPPRPACRLLPNDSALSIRNNDDHIYLKRLEPPNIRILCIEPGPKDSPLECRLEERDLRTDKIEEALSYVWGDLKSDQDIKIDGSSFKVTANLKGILYSLRHEDAPRNIWIDAICINQSNLEEKGHQVRLMRDIYSKALQTTIWLGDWPPETSTSEGEFPMIMERNVNRVAQELLGEFNSLKNQYDLAGMLEKYKEYQTARFWDKQPLGLKIMIARCVDSIMSHPWWERVWTIQEATLPSNEPIIYFRGYQYQYSALISALDVVQEFFEMSESIESTESDTGANYMIATFEFQRGFWQASEMYSSLIRRIRPEKRYGEKNLESPQDRNLQEMLSRVVTYRASDPRDKIFALESLMTKSEGRLIKVDYTETPVVVFKRITAWILNLGQYRLELSIYRLCVESRSGFSADFSGPSWVIDFSYSHAYVKNTYAGLTIEAYLLAFGLTGALPNGKDICLATPTTLFCNGIPISTIYHVKLVPDYAEVGSLDSYENALGFVRSVCREYSDLAKDDGSIERRTCNHPLPGEDEIMRFLCLGGAFVYEQIKGCSNVLGGGERELIRQALHGSTGTYLFITEDSIVGIATAPVQKGDILYLIHRYPSYVILRETEQQGVMKHRIVARAAVIESPDKMKARIGNDPPVSALQII
ncbi:heterokaryon incompatibility protein-domain-containing protein [Rostrohypoxylon terebratum]|nr:heterokaryon incompatibility protein-domain-containing protein [Rostrohypoxylon terebratum]